MKQSDKIYIAGHSGLVGTALVRLLKARTFTNLITRPRAEVDLRDERVVRDFFADERPVGFLHRQPAPLPGHELRIARAAKKENAKHLFADETER
ncbi:MAG: hypothetical protein DME43_05750 [Verrucomicrobia bacterium]|nr:MAG: hypothetical protein DME43_05750 [Verrucomicrobiota bacterium]